MQRNQFINRDEVTKCLNEKGKSLIDNFKKRKCSEEEINMIGYCFAEAILSITECKVYNTKEKE